MPIGMGAFSHAGEGEGGSLTLAWHDAPMRFGTGLGILALVASLSACGTQAPAPEDADASAVDPLVARALFAPLMVDPDLSYANEANAAIAIRHDHALPVFAGSAQLADRAREASRLALLEDGPILDLPPASKAPGGVSLAERYSVNAVLDAVGAPDVCRKGVTQDFAHAANTPGIAAIMPHGMVHIAAASAGRECELSLVRYVTPASIPDALQFHYTIAVREGAQLQHVTQPEAGLTGYARAAQFRVFAREARHDMTAVDVVTWTRRPAPTP
ncbi:MAG: hypothetical protein QNI87_00935 [Erythrobacter sp.]|uniref:hypothetical protein n=1 Tax=Erythrobacter sp. TaxID=1042 RepID=UPI0026027E4B|nr:hypothetical protein [Erythrobacter sp.]MDJ0977082.1 hypothetical protein [Erythrobacter sp.]